MIMDAKNTNEKNRANKVIIDGKGLILGRASSRIAKMLLNGTNVIVLNASELYISGHKKSMLGKYKQRFDLQDKANPEHSPYWSHRPDFFVKRVIRGMLPYKRPKGKEAYKRLFVYSNFPEEFKSEKLFNLGAKSSNETFERAISVKELTERL